MHLLGGVSSPVRTNHGPPPHHSFPIPGGNMPVLEVCLQMGKTEAQINGEFVLKIQPIPCLWALSGLMDGWSEQRAGVADLAHPCWGSLSF